MSREYFYHGVEVLNVHNFIFYSVLFIPHSYRFYNPDGVCRLYPHEWGNILKIKQRSKFNVAKKYRV